MHDPLTRKRGPVGQAAAARAVLRGLEGGWAGCEPAGPWASWPVVRQGGSRGQWRKVSWWWAGIQTASGTWPGGGGAPGWPASGGASVLPLGGGVMVTVTVQPG